MGEDVNCNVGKISKRFKDILGPHGLYNRNLKGRQILYLYKSNNFKILLSFFAHTNYITYRSFNDSKTPHMLDNFIICGKFFKRIRDCKVNRLGVRCDHAAIMTQFRLTAIKFNNNRDDLMILNWQKIQTEKTENSIFNTKLFDLTFLTETSDLRYTEFNDNILSAVQDIATKQKSENRGWFHHSEKHLLPIIAYRDYLLHHLRNQDPTLNLTHL